MEYWRESRPEGWLFPGKPKISPPSPRQLNRAFTSAKHMAGTNKPATLHTLRHNSVAFRRYTLLPLDDCLYALQPSIPHLTRSARYWWLQRYGISRLRVVRVTVIGPVGLDHCFSAVASGPLLWRGPNQGLRYL